MDFRNTLIYCDPPYYTGALSWPQYEEMAFWEYTIPKWLTPGHGNVVVMSSADGEHPASKRKLGLHVEHLWSTTHRNRTKKSRDGACGRVEYLFRVHLAHADHNADADAACAQPPQADES